MTTSQLWRREYSNARYLARTFPAQVDAVQYAASTFLDKLRTITVLRPGQRILPIPGFGVTMLGRAVQSAAADWWAVTGKTCVAAYQPKGAADLAASYVNLATPGTYNAAPGTAPTHASATGWTFNGSTQYLLTNIVATNAQSWILRIANTTEQGRGAFGAYEAGKVNVNFYPKYSGGRRYFRCSGSFDEVAPADFAAGVAAGTPAAAYWNGASVGAMSGNFTGSSTITIYLGVMVDPTNIPPTSGILWAGDILAFAIYSDTLTAGEVAAKSALMAAL